MSEPTAQYPPRLRIAESLDAAFETMRRLVLATHSLPVWVSFGVIIFLETQFDNLRFPALHYFDPEKMEDRGIREQAEFLIEFIRDNGAAVLGIVLLSLIGYVIVLVVTTWLRTRASLMFVRAVAEGDHRIEANWHATRPLHQSLFILTLFLRALRFATQCFAVGASALVLFIFGVDHVISFVGAVVFLAPIALVSTLVLAALWILTTLLREFVVPIMWRDQVSAATAIAEFREIARGNFPALALYLLVLLAFKVVITVIAVLVGIFSCGIGFLPVIHQAILSPIYVMQRAVAIHMLEATPSSPSP